MKNLEQLQAACGESGDHGQMRAFTKLRQSEKVGEFARDGSVRVARWTGTGGITAWPFRPYIPGGPRPKIRAAGCSGAMAPSRDRAVARRGRGDY